MRKIDDYLDLALRHDAVTTLIIVLMGFALVAWVLTIWP
jgi:hypothetical protein